MSTTPPAGVAFAAPITPRYAEVLTPEALAFIVRLHRAHNARRKELLAARVLRQAALDAGAKPDFLPETAAIRDAEWTVAPLPADLLVVTNCDVHSALGHMPATMFLLALCSTTKMLRYRPSIEQCRPSGCLLGQR